MNEVGSMLLTWLAQVIKQATFWNVQVCLWFLWVLKWNLLPLLCQLIKDFKCGFFVEWSLQGVQLMLPLQTSTDHHLTVLLDLTSWMKHSWVAPKNPDNRWQQASIVARTVQQPMPRKFTEKGRGEIKSWVEAIWQAKKKSSTHRVYGNCSDDVVDTALVLYSPVWHETDQGC